MICDTIWTSVNGTELLQNMRIISRVDAEFCSNACFHKIAFCIRSFQDKTEIVFNYGTGI
jgi:hypothetical protein